MITQNEIAKLAREYAEDATKADAGDPNLSASDLNDIKRDVAEYADKVISWLFRTHCIVSKEKVNEADGEVLSGWVAREESGDLFVYRAKPIRNIYTKRWEGERSDIDIYNNLLFPDLTWDSEPMEVEITIKPKKK